MENITVAVVCDGVGSASQGAQAAKRTCNFLVHSLKNRPKSWSMEKSIKHFIENAYAKEHHLSRSALLQTATMEFIAS